MNMLIFMMVSLCCGIVDGSADGSSLSQSTNGGWDAIIPELPEDEIVPEIEVPLSFVYSILALRLCFAFCAT